MHGCRVWKIPYSRLLSCVLHNTHDDERDTEGRANNNERKKAYRPLRVGFLPDISTPRNNLIEQAYLLCVP
jgi:hypothetical protein